MIPPEVLQNLSDLPLHNKSGRISFCEIDFLGLLKVKAGNLRGILIVVRVKLEKKKHDKNHTVSISFMRLTRNLADNFP